MHAGYVLYRALVCYCGHHRTLCDDVECNHNNIMIITTYKYMYMCICMLHISNGTSPVYTFECALFDDIEVWIWYCLYSTNSCSSHLLYLGSESGH